MIPRRLLPIFLLPVLNAQISFGPPVELTESIATGIAHAMPADMDGDGDPDALVAEEHGVRVLWWENDGAGNFSRAGEWRWGDLDWTVIGLVDWNGDGRPDVWLQHDDPETSDPETGMVMGNYAVAVNRGDGGFDVPTVIGVHPINSYLANEPFVADMNGDGLPDLVTSLGVHFANSGGFFPDSVSPLDPYLWDGPEDVVVFDAEGDGDADLLITSIHTEDQLTYVRNLGAAGFAPPAVLLGSENDSYSAHCVVPGASAGEFRLLVIGKTWPDDAQTLRSFSLTGNAELSVEASLPLPEFSIAREVTWDDLRVLPDGRVLLFSSVSPSQLFPPGIPAAKIHEVTWADGALELVEIGEYPGYSEHGIPTLADLDGDSLADLFLPLPRLAGVTGSTVNRVVWQAGVPGGSFSAEGREVVRGSGELKLFAVRDIDGDGDTDLLSGASSLLMSGPGVQGLELWRNTVGEFERTAISHGRERIDIIEVRDVSGPAGEWESESPNHGKSWPAGRLDFLAQTVSESPLGGPKLEWFFQDETGGFHRWSIPGDGSRDLAPVTYVDWDGDGTRDLLSWESWYDWYSILTFRKGEGYGFGPATDLALLPSMGRTPVAVTDLDRDGDPDITGVYVLSGFPGNWMENDGAGGIAALRGLSIAPSPIPDLDGDGYRDFVHGDQIMLVRPGLTFESRIHPRPNQPSRHGSFVDLDQDGDLDFIATLPTGNITGYSRIRWWENRGDARFFPQSGIPIADELWASREQFAVADLDGDGTRDLIVASGGPSRLEWFRGALVGGPPLFSSWMGESNLSGHSAGPGSDWDGDGILNWDEFAFGSDPAASDPSHPGRPRLERTGGSLSFTFQRRLDAVSAGLSYPMEHAPNLTDWEDWTPPEEVLPATGGYERVRVPVAADQPAGFFRVVVPVAP